MPGVRFVGQPCVVVAHPSLSHRNRPRQDLRGDPFVYVVITAKEIIVGLFKGLTYRENYEEAIAYLSNDEPKHSPKFDMVSAPVELQELISKAYLPRSEERSKWLNDFAVRCWEVPDGEADVLLAEDHLNAIRYVNRYLRKANDKLKQGGFLVVSFDSAAKRRVQFFSKYPKPIAKFLYFFDFLWHRVCPKMGLTRRLYYFCNRKQRKVFPRPEILGRLYYCGYDVVHP